MSTTSFQESKDIQAARNQQRFNPSCENEEGNRAELIDATASIRI